MRLICAFAAVAMAGFFIGSYSKLDYETDCKKATSDEVLNIRQGVTR